MTNKDLAAEYLAAKRATSEAEQSFEAARLRVESCRAARSAAESALGNLITVDRPQLCIIVGDQAVVIYGDSRNANIRVIGLDNLSEL